MTALDNARRDLVHANRILAQEGVVDAYGHVSVRHPDNPEHFLLSKSRSPELVEESDIMEFTLDGEPVDPDAGQPYLERYIHAAVLAERPEINSVIHSHAEEVIPFGVTNIPLRPVFHVGSRMGHAASRWDIKDKFGETNLLVTNMDQGRDMAKALGLNRVVLMRGHGFTAATEALYTTVFAAIYTQVNARVLTRALGMSDDITYLSEAEIDNMTGSGAMGSVGQIRAWEYFCRRAGCGGQS
jgi:ribulose-5-phosphate 4-epimerase/fuculose-1-phosphate aldolase